MSHQLQSIPSCSLVPELDPALDRSRDSELIIVIPEALFQEKLEESGSDTDVQDIVSSDVLMCRICHRNSNPDFLVSPCDCKGSISYVHLNCLEHWLEVKNSDICELCHYQFELIKTQKSCMEFFKDPATAGERQKILSFTLWILFSTAFVVIFVFNCMRTAFESAVKEYNIWKAVIFYILGIIAASAQVSIIVYASKQMYKIINRWRNVHYTVRVLYRNPSASPNFRSQKADLVVDQRSLIELTSRSDVVDDRQPLIPITTSETNDPVLLSPSDGPVTSRE